MHGVPLFLAVVAFIGLAIFLGRRRGNKRFRADRNEAVAAAFAEGGEASLKAALSQSVTVVAGNSSTGADLGQQAMMMQLLQSDDALSVIKALLRDAGADRRILPSGDQHRVDDGVRPGLPVGVVLSPVANGVLGDVVSGLSRPVLDGRPGFVQLDRVRTEDGGDRLDSGEALDVGSTGFGPPVGFRSLRRWHDLDEFPDQFYGCRFYDDATGQHDDRGCDLDHRGSVLDKHYA